MTKTMASLKELQKEVPHLTQRSGENHTLQWESDVHPVFEILCKGGTSDQLKSVDNLLSEAYKKACITLI